MQVSTERHWLTPPDFALLIATNLIWGLNLVAAKLGVGEFPPIFFAGLRFAILAAVLVPLLRVFHGQMTTLLQAAAFSGGLCFAALYLGLKLASDISSVAIATQLGIPMSTLMSIWLLGEKIRWRRKLGITLSFVGVAAISFDPRAFDHVLGLMMVIASQVFMSLGLIHIKRLRNVTALQLQAWLSVVGAPTLLLISAVSESGQLEAVAHATWIGWTSLLFTAVASSLIAHTLMFHLIAKYPVTSVAPMNVLSALFSIACGVVWFGDVLTPKVLIGGTVALIGVVIVALREQRMVDTGT